MNDLSAQVRQNRARAAEIVKTVHSMERNLSLCDCISSDEFVRAMLTDAISNAGPVQLWLDNYLESRTPEYMEALSVGVVANPVSLPSPPTCWELTHDWCVPFARGYVMACRDAIEQVIELQNAPETLSIKAWEHLAAQLKEYPIACVKEIATELSSIVSEMVTEHPPGELLLGISREAAAAILVASKAGDEVGEESKAVVNKEEQPRQPKRNDRSAFYATLNIDVHIEKHYRGAASDDVPHTKGGKHRLLVSVIDTWELAELNIHDDWEIPRTAKALYESARRFERWIEAGNPDPFAD